MISINDNIKRALENPEKFYWNTLSEEDDSTILLSDTCIYLCVLLYLVTTLDIDNKLIDKYIDVYRFQLDREILAHKKSINDSEEKLFRQCEKFPFIRDIIYKNEKEHLFKSVTKEDYLNYLNKYGDTCREFMLFAKFRIAQLGNLKDNRFEFISEIINSFPHSDLFDVEYLKTLCVNINGLSVCFTSDATDVQKDTVIALIREAIYNNESETYIIITPLSKLQIVNLLKFDVNILSSAINNIDDIQHLNISNAKLLLSILNQLTGLSWEFPNIGLVLNNDVLSSNKDIIWTEDCEDSDSVICRYYALQPILKLKEL
jgi:hypothetical protein